MQVALDTSCVINLLSPEEQPKPALLALIRLALDGQLRINVTPIVDEEIPRAPGSQPVAPTHRSYIRRSLDQFRVAEITSGREAERDALASRLLSLLWPDIQAGSNRHPNAVRDCEHLASHRLCGGDVFLTLDAPLVQKAARHAGEVGVEVMAPDDLLQRVSPAGGSATDGDAWRPLVRRANEDDRGEIRELLVPIRDTYDDFDGWLARALRDKEMWLGILDGRIGAVSVWGHKVGTSTVKLSTFYVGDAFSGRGLGPHLLFQQIRLWIEARVAKVFVTVSSKRIDALTFFLQYGFRIEGASARRYQSDAVEFVLAKHFLYETITDSGLDDFVSRFGQQVFGLPPDASVTAPENWFLPPSLGSLRVQRTDGRVTEVQVVDAAGVRLRGMSLNMIEELVYPARFAIGGREAYLIPIQPRWADAMMRVPRPQGSLFVPSDKLALRTDHAYYCHPRYLDEQVEQSPALFYVSAPDSMVAGFARILTRDIAEPEDLFLHYDRLGIYGLDSIRGHVQSRGRHAGCAMAVKFAWWVAFPRPVSLDVLRAQFGLEAPQTITAIEFELYEAIVAAGGITW